MVVTLIATDANINIQMNYWAAEVTGMDVMRPLFNFFEVLRNYSLLVLV